MNIFETIKKTWKQLVANSVAPRITRIIDLGKPMVLDAYRIELNPGDKIIVRIPDPVPYHMIEELKGTLEEKFAGHDVIVLTGGAELYTVG